MNFIKKLFRSKSYINESLESRYERLWKENKCLKGAIVRSIALFNVPSVLLPPSEESLELMLQDLKRSLEGGREGISKEIIAELEDM